MREIDPTERQHPDTSGSRTDRSWVERHFDASLKVFMFIVVVHWLEHITQAFQYYAMGWSNERAQGVLGVFYPWLVQSEAMHYAYALVMLIGLWMLRVGFTGSARQCWMMAVALQVWHHFEHLLLFIQAIVGQNLGGGPAPASIVQFFIPRIELHLFYNAVVTVPMVIALVLAHREANESIDATTR